MIILGLFFCIASEDRLDAFDRGEMEAIPAEQVFGKMGSQSIK
jgi:hypothetical protein